MIIFLITFIKTFFASSAYTYRYMNIPTELKALAFCANGHVIVYIVFILFCFPDYNFNSNAVKGCKMRKN